MNQSLKTFTKSSHKIWEAVLPPNFSNDCPLYHLSASPSRAKVAKVAIRSSGHCIPSSIFSILKSQFSASTGSPTPIKRGGRMSCKIFIYLSTNVSLLELDWGCSCEC
ncbi:hypothetical protein MA16_Dca015226 [Dendrobium catenatum]|uniref:Uncharacterized protein n=1 Tax=Dendrobium catenatum TaxID=906689 RepID=A0A2I0VSD7_9ASPA|nr:hypothetical protein MA16_Dca015226 [Dendrobium catenatum]